MGDEASPEASGPSAPQGQTTQDLLADIFGTSDDSPSPSLSPSGAPPKSSVNDILGLFDSSSISAASPKGSYTTPPPHLPPSPAPNAMGDLFSAISSTPGVVSPPIPQAPQEHEVYSQHGLRITLTGVRDAANPLVANILAKFSAAQPTAGVSFQAAVPKAQRLQMMAMSRPDVAPGSVETQQLRVMVPAPGVRLCISFFASRNLLADHAPLCLWLRRASSGCASGSPFRSRGRLSRTKQTLRSRLVCFEGECWWVIGRGRMCNLLFFPFVAFPTPSRRGAVLVSHQSSPEGGFEF